MQSAARSPADTAYAQGVEQLRLGPYLDYPAHVHLETLALCTAACDFCPYPSLERKGERMPDELIDKVLRELGDIPRGLPFQLSPFKVNEPFLDKRLFPLLERVNRELPQATLTLTTNATPLTARVLDRLDEVQNLGYLWVSVNDHRAEDYERAMRLPFEKTLARLDTLHERVEAGTLRTRVVLSRVGDGSAVDANFANWVQERYPLFSTSIFPRGNWLGQVDTPIGDVPDIPCGRWFELSITATGEVAHCCMDGRAEWPIGNVREQHVLEVYNAPEYRHLRERTASRLDADPCRTCTFR